MNKTQRRIALGATLICGVLGLSGCGSLIDAYSADSVPTSVDLSKKPTINALFPDSGFSDDEFKTGYTAKLLGEVTGYDVVYNQVKGTDADNVITNYLTTKAPYNFMKLGLGQFDGHITEEAFLPLEDVLASYGPDLLKIIPQTSWETAKYNGHIYGIPETAFSSMCDNALIFRWKDLKEVGITSLPSTIEEFTAAVEALQTHFSANNSSYHAFSLFGAGPTCPAIADAFDLPKDFYVDSDKKIQNYIYSEHTMPYLNYMNGFVQKGIMAKSWSSSSNSDVLSTFVKGNASIAYLPYWYMVPLYTQLAQVYSSEFASLAEAKAGIGWVLNLRGDGTSGSVSQTVAKHQGGMGNAYMISIPWYMGEQAPYVIDYMNTKIKDANYELLLCGREGEGYSLSNQDDPDAIPVTINGTTTYRKLLPLYDTAIKDNSMYQTGGNGPLGKACWPMREKGFDCWSVLMDIDENTILNPLSLYPVLPAYSKISIASASYVMTYVQQAINSTNQTSTTKSTAAIMEKLKSDYLSRYWTSDVADAVNAWYASQTA